jgi:serine/threonine protein kinase
MRAGPVGRKVRPHSRLEERRAALVFLVTVPPSLSGPQRVLERYALYDEIAAGGMATVHLGRLLGPVGFSRTIAIKRLHPQYAKDHEFVAMFLDEARLASRIRHPNVVSTIDVVAKEGELFLVMEYVMGESLSRLMSGVRVSKATVPLNVASGIAFGFLNGLHAAHEAKDERGVALGIVHRDVSPQNVLVGTDGVARALDFGVAKAVTQVHSTRDGQLKGKLAYMAPEQLEGRSSRAVDIYAASVVLWETLTAKRLFHGDSERAILAKVLVGAKDPPSAHNPEVPPELDAVIMRGLAIDPADRYPTALEMARAIAKIVPIAPPIDIGEWVERTAGVAIAQRMEMVARIEAESSTGSQVATRLAAAAVAGTDPGLALGSTPPPPPPSPRPSPQQAAPQPRLQVDPSDDHLSTQFSGESIVRPAPPAPSRLPRSLIAGAAVLGCAGLVGVVFLVLRPPSPGARATAPVEAVSSFVATQAPPPASVIEPAPPPATASASASTLAPTAHAPSSTTTVKRPVPAWHPSGPRVDDPLLQAR